MGAAARLAGIALQHSDLANKGRINPDLKEIALLRQEK